MRDASSIGLTSAALLLTLALAAFAEDAGQVVGALFGEKIKKVEATATRTDDVALAGEMLEVSRGETVTPGMRAAICEKAAELAMRDAAGFATAIEAMKLWPTQGSAAEQEAIADKQSDLLTRIFQTGKPADKTAAGAMLIDLLVQSGDTKLEAKQYAEAVGVFRKASTLAPRAKPEAAGAIKSKLEYATYRERTTRQIEVLRAKLLEDRGDSASAEALVKLLIIDEQNPKEAQKYADAVKDEMLKKVLALVKTPTADLSAADAVTLAEWFAAVAKTAQGPSQAASLAQAKTHYEQVLSRSDADNLTKTKAGLQLKDIDARFAQTDGRPVTAPTKADSGKWTNLLQSADVAKETVFGSWKATKTGLESAKARSLLRLPVTATGDYECRIKITRIDGVDGFGLIFPVGSNHFAEFMVDGWISDGGRTGIAMDGKDPGNSKSTIYNRKYLKNDKPAVLHFGVSTNDEDVRIKILLDDEVIIDWKGSVNSFSKNKDATDSFFGLRTAPVAYRVEQFEVKALSGRIKSFRESK